MNAHHPTITDALELAEGIPEDAGNWHVLRPLLIALRTLAKDQEKVA